ncbi:hypothetical protein ACPESR_25495 [Nocardia testacea]|uniref:hypothetical protein n=1 Tax=Nocardia testacea TaxID=248551 RepID=UPI003C2AD34E
MSHYRTAPLVLLGLAWCAYVTGHIALDIFLACLVAGLSMLAVCWLPALLNAVAARHRKRTERR